MWKSEKQKNKKVVREREEKENEAYERERIEGGGLYAPGRINFEEKREQEEEEKKSKSK